MSVAGDRLLAQNGTRQFWPNYSQLHTEGTISVLTKYLLFVLRRQKHAKICI